MSKSRRNKQFGSECVCCIFHVSVIASIVDEGFLLTVEEEVGRFMEKREPEKVIGFVPIAQCDHASSRRCPPGGSTYATSADLLDEDECYSDLSANVNKSI